MEAVHRRRLNEQFGEPLDHRKLVVLGIPDKYRFMDPELVALLRKKVLTLLPGVR